MNRKQIENLYMVNGLKDYKLKNTDNLLNIHGIDFKEVNGYDTLDDTNKTIFKRFIINFFNAWGLVDRTFIIPKGIYNKDSYLRFELLHNDKKTWYHVINEGIDWY